MNNKPKICPYCNEELELLQDYYWKIIDKNKSHFDLKNARRQFFYICKYCEQTVGNINEDKVDWVSKEEAFIRKKTIYENVYKKFELDENLKKIIPKWFNDVKEKYKND